MASRPPLADVSSNALVAALPAESTKPVAATKKRKAAAVEREEIDIDDDRCQIVTINCNQVRAKIQKFLDSGEMKVGEFQKAIGASSATYGNFMRQSGPYRGSGSSIYQNAFAFFKHRELNRIKPAKKQAIQDDFDKSIDVSKIVLEGEEKGDVPVYDTCDVIRAKIRELLASPSITQASFAREISKTFSDGKKVTGAQLSAFLSKKGPTSGNTSMVFYASYVFFEKIRIRDGKEKTEFRKEMEEIYNGYELGAGKNPGMDLKKLSSRRALSVHGDTQVYEDKYGRLLCD